MFMTTELALIFIIFKLLMGSVIGLVVSSLVYRSRLSIRLAVVGALLGGTAFLLASGIAGWAGSHAAFNNGHRLDVAPWGENLWLRNRIADHEVLISVASSCVAALFAGLNGKRRPDSAQ
jgi:hypothetical protein